MATLGTVTLRIQYEDAVLLESMLTGIAESAVRMSTIADAIRDGLSAGNSSGIAFHQLSDAKIEPGRSRCGLS